MSSPIVWASRGWDRKPERPVIRLSSGRQVVRRAPAVPERERFLTTARRAEERDTSDPPPRHNGYDGGRRMRAAPHLGPPRSSSPPRLSWQRQPQGGTR